IALCYGVRNHYKRVAKAIEQLEVDILPQLYSAKALDPSPRDPNAPTAVLLVNGFNGLGLATMLKIEQLFPGEFRNIVFVGVGEVDSALLRSHEEIEEVEKQIADDLLSYYDFASQLGFHPETRTG